jgi:hypothetical protein
MLITIESTTNCTIETPIKRANALTDKYLNTRNKTRVNTSIFPVPIKVNNKDFIVEPDLDEREPSSENVSGLRSRNIYFINCHNASEVQKLIIIPIARLRVRSKDL